VIPSPGEMPPRRPWSFVSIFLITLGLLMLVPSGLCTGLFGGGALFGGDQFLRKYMAGFFVMGGSLFVVGAGLVWLGVHLHRTR
jgi:hypothetical protein